jgi:hypothetical protein
MLHRGERIPKGPDQVHVKSVPVSLPLTLRPDIEHHLKAAQLAPPARLGLESQLMRTGAAIDDDCQDNHKCARDDHEPQQMASVRRAVGDHQDAERDGADSCQEQEPREHAHEPDYLHGGGHFHRKPQIYHERGPVRQIAASGIVSAYMQSRRREIGPHLSLARLA